jgi:hypothetical protein
MAAHHVHRLEKTENRLHNIFDNIIFICITDNTCRIDDKGYWTRIESYIRSHSEAEFSHGICPDCAEKLYGNMKKNKE